MTSAATPAWAEVERCYEALRGELAARGLPVRSTLAPAGGVLSAWSDGVVHVAPVSLDSPGDALRAALHAAMMGVTPAEAAWLFRALLPRLLGHELGHALRGERGLLGGDRRAEEQVAERLATLLSRPLVSPRDRERARAMLGGVAARLGGAAEAAALHRHAPLALRALGLSASPAAVAAMAERLQTAYFRDLAAYLRVQVSWAWIDLTLDVGDTLDDFRREHLGG